MSLNSGQQRMANASRRYFFAVSTNAWKSALSRRRSSSVMSNERIGSATGAHGSALSAKIFRALSTTSSMVSFSVEMPKVSSS